MIRYIEVTLDLISRTKMDNNSFFHKITTVNRITKLQLIVAKI